MQGLVDGAGIYGTVLHYALVMAFVGSAFLAFIYCWCKGQLNMDEAPKFQMMQSDEPSHDKEKLDER